MQVRIGCRLCSELDRERMLELEVEVAREWTLEMWRCSCWKSTSLSKRARPCGNDEVAVVVVVTSIDARRGAGPPPAETLRL